MFYNEEKQDYEGGSGRRDGGGVYKYVWRENHVAMYGEFCEGEGV